MKNTKITQLPSQATNPESNKSKKFQNPRNYQTHFTQKYTLSVCNSMAEEEDNPTTPQASMPGQDPSPKTAQQSPVFSQASSSHLPHSANNHSNPNYKYNVNNSSPLAKNPRSPEDFILSVAANFASQPFQYSDPDVWGVLTAISEKARKRHQGMNMLLTSDEHCIGRLVDEPRFQIISPAVSAHHCKIYRKRVASDDKKYPSNNCISVFLKDSSTNGTYLNWEKLNKSSSEAELHHGDIISIAFTPQHELAFAFVFREVQKSPDTVDGGHLKRKAEEFGSESKRSKGIGIGIGLGASDGPISLDDFRSLQRSNTDLRKLLENQVVTIESLRSENRADSERHEIEIRELKESVTKSYLDQLSDLCQSLEAKEKELAELNKISAEQKHEIEGLNERLSASVQSCVEANEIINSQQRSISELKALLDEERDQRREEREKSAVDIKASILRVQAEAEEEIKRISDAALRREKEQQEVINKLQEAEKKRCSLVETLRSKLEDTRQKLVVSDNRVRQLEAQIREEQLACASNRKKVEELEHERKRLRKELEREKAAREEAWAKVSALELEINSAMRDIDFERRRLKGARERIMLRETQLRAFYSTTEEISVLFAKQQEQLKSMQRTLEDEENYETTSADIDLNPNIVSVDGVVIRNKEVEYLISNVGKAGSSTSAHRRGEVQVESSRDEASVTKKHDCNAKIQEDGEDTQEVEFTGAERNVKGGFGSDIDGVCTAPISGGNAVGTEQILGTEGFEAVPILEGVPFETEQVLETESPGLDSGRNIDLNKCSTLAGDTMQLDDETHAEETQENDVKQTSHHSQPNSPLEDQNLMEDTEAGGTIRTAELLASEVVGSWACSTAPSVHGENYSPTSKDNDEEGAAALHESSSLVAESQHIPCFKSDATARRNHERLALCQMIGIVDPDLREQSSHAAISGSDQDRGEREVTSDSVTEDCPDNDDDNKVDAQGESDAETVGSDQANEDPRRDNEMDEDDDATQEDSVG
ncbi:coiled-coil domain-containing 186 isoform X2 [Olea europaea subsp. europaea]|uniref:Coiled-coil domain-containing 186 isoform X2 n=2 Tax=Olea europaea subsp. europaea TaxID=158383 RepID=A0A8S0RIS7_OLEEU|nr:coiled-coil domain-containing 186 isoform X2 [Olea europaea subsp. europaea]